MKAKAILLFASVLLAGCHATQYDDNQSSKSANGLPSASSTEQNKSTYATLDWLDSEDDQYQDIWVYLSNEISITIPNNARVDEQRKRYVNNKRYLTQVADKAEPYMYWIVSELNERNMPVELALLPIVESAFDTQATSSAKAAGMWQIVPTTGLYYGLKQDQWYDGRRDVAASTTAALNMLQRLNKMFDGDWLLTIAAYNSGEGRVLNAIKENKAKGKPTDFWSLNLPKETSIYVPKLLALIDVIKNQQQYSVELPQGNPKRALDQIDVGKQIELEQIASMTGISLTKIRALNAGYKHSVTPPDGPHKIMLPRSHSAILEDSLSSQPESNLVTRTSHTYSTNESLEELAKRYNSHVDAILVANNLPADATPEPGQSLSIPLFSEDVADSIQKATVDAKKITVTSRKGQYSVTSGDTLSGIARKLKVSTVDLQKWNKLKNAHALKIGQKLAYQTNSNNLRKITYNVRSGDTMTSISNRYNLDINDVLQWNRSLPNINMLKLGEQLTLYIN